MTDGERRQSEAASQDVLTTVRKRLELVINEIADAELIAMLRTAVSELDLAQSDAEPVVQTEFELEDGLHELAFPAPPRPDASAGLIEAAEIAEQCANGSFSKNEAMYLRGFATKLRAVAAVRNNPEAFAKLKALRARAANRSGK